MWMHTLFKKLDIDHIITKCSEWLHVCDSLIVSLEDDAVLRNLHERLSSLRHVLPLLSHLSHPAFQVRHWKRLFTALSGSFGNDITINSSSLLVLRLYYDVINDTILRVLCLLLA